MGTDLQKKERQPEGCQKTAPYTETADTVRGQAGGLFADFCEIVRQLRAENGCPWDRAQTFETLRPCMANEMTEALAGILLYEKSGNADNLCEELGDVLLQVVLLSQIAEEEGLFAITDVLDGISRKMIRRHPHVFAGERFEPSQDGCGEEERWERIKMQEKKNRAPGQEEEEREAFRAAASWVTEHLAGRLQEKKQ